VSLNAHNQADGQLKTRENIKFYKEKTIAGTGSGCEQPQGHEL
jgi:hypothetical protein